MGGGDEGRGGRGEGGIVNEKKRRCEVRRNFEDKKISRREIRAKSTEE